MIGDISHICNRGLEKRKIFVTERDYHRFVVNLFRLNNKGAALRNVENSLFEQPQNKLVEILQWSLLPNHYHLLVYEKTEGGTLSFAKRLGNAFTKYVNTKEERNGYLFGNHAKIVPIKKDSQFLYIPFYIDLNPLDLGYPKWKTGGVTNPERALDFLLQYKWSSFQDHFTNRPCKAILNQKLFYDLFETTREEYRTGLLEFLDREESVDLTGRQMDKLAN
ncbi:MAG: hypothetical protein Q7R88_03280 [bacterium]|nr:hypothetical protein [bacterium]